MCSCSQAAHKLKNTPPQPSTLFTDMTDVASTRALDSAKRRAHTCNGTSAGALGALPRSLACSIACARCTLALSTFWHTTRSPTTAQPCRSAQGQRHAILITENDDEIIDVIDWQHDDRAVGYRFSHDSKHTPIVKATFPTWCRRPAEYGRASTSEA